MDPGSARQVVKQRCEQMERDIKFEFSEMEAELNVQSPEDKQERKQSEALMRIN
jgi:hypothetical protein